MASDRRPKRKMVRLDKGAAILNLSDHPRFKTRIVTPQKLY
jgi:hypothetical protein